MLPVAIFRHNPTEGPGYFATVLERHGIAWQLVPVDAGAPVPESAREFSGLAFMGGPMSVNDDLPWIPPALQLIRDAVGRGVPVLGHCLGGQLMAKALGGEVTRNAVKEIGWGRVDVADGETARAWFGRTRSFLAYHWHGETFTVPPGAARVASSPYCATQAFALGASLGLQCHVEMTEEMIRAWAESGRREIEHANSPAVQSREEMQRHLQARVAALHGTAEQLYGRWISGIARE